MSVAEQVTRMLGTRPVTALWRRVRPGLRILAFHEVPDANRFAEQLDVTGEHHRFVSGDEVAAARRGTALAPNAVWVTFDDGDTTVFRDAAPVLAERGIPATAFVCPGLIEEQRPPWWTIVLAAGEQGEGALIDGQRLRGAELVRTLKTVTDSERRRIIADLPAPTVDEPLTTVEDLRSWLDAGFELGNHTWDHPCLDRCTEEEQRDQIREGHRWLTEFLGSQPATFAYPNGDRTEFAARYLDELGYDTVLLFDHRLARVTADSAELSRLRLDAGADPTRTRAIVSGAHADLFGVTRGR